VITCTCTWPGDGLQLHACTRQTHPWRKGVEPLAKYIRSLPEHLKPTAFRITEFPEGHLPSIGDADRVLGRQTFATALDEIEASTAVKAQRIRDALYSEEALREDDELPGPGPKLDTPLKELEWRIAANAGRISHTKRARWAHVMEATGLGSNSAAELCIRAGLDPYELIGDFCNATNQLD